MEDRREQIIEGLIMSDKYYTADNFTTEFIKDAMDENGRQMCLELLEYMAKNNVDVDCVSGERDDVFYYKGEWITKEQLFESFL